MCRIAGIYNPRAENLELDILRMRDAMRRGGPDDAGVFLHPTLPLALGHRRLSFLDLSSAGHQPMHTPDEQLTIVFNGEIYNFKEIRQELESLGYQFRTQTDTEVILYSYRQWRDAAFEKFDGMFAIAIWDEKEQEITLVRDHAGIKPLYYFLEKNVLIFASEIRAFRTLSLRWQTEEAWKPLFMLFGHLPEPFSTIKGVKTLEKGSWIKIKLPSFDIKKGFFFKDQLEPKVFSQETSLELVRDILPAAVKRHLISDAPIGLFLSGGIDSSLLTLLAAPILRENLKTLSIQFEESEYSEEAFQKIIIDVTQADHHPFRVSRRLFEESLEDLLEAMDQPSIDAINTYFISMYARHTGLKAVLSGLGADEIFGGYPSFNRFQMWRYLKYVPNFVSKWAEKSSNGKIAKLSYERYHPMLSLYLMNRGLNTVDSASRLTGVSPKVIEDALNEITVPANLDYRTANANSSMEMNFYMKNQLLKDSDYMSMWHGLEIRVPFLDKELLTAVSSIHPDIKFKRQIPKSILIESFSTLLPAEIWNRKKQGFTFPFASWLKDSAILQPSDSMENKYFQEFSSGKLHWSRYWALKVAANEKFN